MKIWEVLKDAELNVGQRYIAEVNSISWDGAIIEINKDKNLTWVEVIKGGTKTSPRLELLKLCGKVIAANWLLIGETI